MTALATVDAQAKRARFRLMLARVLLTPLCVAAVVLAGSRDLLASFFGESWFPRIQLHLQFTSLCFLLVFLPCVLMLYALYRKTAVANWILTAAGLTWYATAGVIYLVPLLFTCVLDYAVGAYLARADDERRRTMVFVASVAVQLFLLCAFKYAGWLSTDLAGMLAAVGAAAFAPIALPLPPGISFYTFHTISYTADVYRREFQPRGRLIDYITFVGFFPQLIAGPIARASELLPQIAAVRPAISLAAAEEALWLIAWGLFKKITLADNFGVLVTQAATDLHAPNHGGVGYLFMVAFAGQVYCDFSAYTDIARGIARLFGIELPRNFLTPYFAISPADFWQRWHISLSRFIRSYLYEPIVFRALRKRAARGLPVSAKALAAPVPFLTTFVWPILFTMSLFGLWHGAGIGFVIWGFYNGALLVLYRLLPLDRLLQRYFKTAGTALATMLMFAFTCFGFIFFRAAAMDMLPLFGSLAHWPPFSRRLVLLAAPLIVTEWIGYRRGTEFVDVYGAIPWWTRPLLFVVVFYGIIFFGAREQNEFIYFQF